MSGGPVRVSSCCLCGRGYRVLPELDCYDCQQRVAVEERTMNGPACGDAEAAPSHPPMRDGALLREESAA